jgi:hypothetical protein
LLLLLLGLLLLLLPAMQDVGSERSPLNAEVIVSATVQGCQAQLLFEALH